MRIVNWDNYGDVLSELQSFGLLVDLPEVGRQRRYVVNGLAKQSGALAPGCFDEPVGAALGDPIASFLNRCATGSAKPRWELA